MCVKPDSVYTPVLPADVRLLSLSVGLMATPVPKCPTDVTSEALCLESRTQKPLEDHFKQVCLLSDYADGDNKLI